MRLMYKKSLTGFGPYGGPIASNCVKVIKFQADSRCVCQVGDYLPSERKPTCPLGKLRKLDS